MLLLNKGMYSVDELVDASGTTLQNVALHLTACEGFLEVYSFVCELVSKMPHARVVWAVRSRGCRCVGGA